MARDYISLYERSIERDGRPPGLDSAVAEQVGQHAD